MFFKKAILFSLLLIVLAIPCSADYTVNGKVNISSDWQPQIFLSTITKLDDYYNANPADIIQVGNIEDDGSFTIKGDNLPLKPRFYRLYLVKENNSEFDACLYFEEDEHNFIHLILDNNTHVEIDVDTSHFAPFGEYTITGDEANIELQELSKLISPSFYFYQIRFPSELQFSEQKLNRDLFEFADSSKNILVSLAAIINTDMDQYYEHETEKYNTFGNRLSAELNNHSYTEDYFRKLSYYNGDMQSSKISSWMYIVILLLVGALTYCVYQIIYLKQKIAQLKNSYSDVTLNSIPSFTRQEEKILSLILAEKSNKEIASDLFIELSTVKTHINKLYAKLGVKSRNEAKTIAKGLKI